VRAAPPVRSRPHKAHVTDEAIIAVDDLDNCVELAGRHLTVETGRHRWARAQHASGIHTAGDDGARDGREHGRTAEEPPRDRPRERLSYLHQPLEVISNAATSRRAQHELAAMISGAWPHPCDGGRFGTASAQGRAVDGWCWRRATSRAMGAHPLVWRQPARTASSRDEARYEPLDRLVCVVLDLRVAKVGNDLGLVDDRSGDLVAALA